jgi:hypothetical protein
MVSAFIYCLRRHTEIYYPVPETIQDDEDSVQPKPVSPLFLSSDSQDIRNIYTHPITFVVYILVLIYGFGSAYQTFAPYPGRFYQRPTFEFAPPTVQMSCLVNGDLASTAHHLNTTGIYSKFVIWSEQSMNVDDEGAFLEEAKQLSSRTGVYLGLAYRMKSSSPRYQNRDMFTLVVPPSNSAGNQSSIGFRYQKAYPVPFLEQHVQPGPQSIAYVDTPYGRIGGSM